MKKITILGSTGSIGTQALDVVRLNTDKFCVHGLVAGNNIQVLAQQIKEFNPVCVAIFNEEKLTALKELIPNFKGQILCGQSGINAVAMESVDSVVGAITGAAGLESVIVAIRAKNTIALANKESLVCAGEMVMTLAQQNGVEIIPVDSEHSALFQVFSETNRNSLDKLVLTASGGAFLHTPYEKILQSTPKEALQHPNWTMGQKVTIDSAGLMNKGLELIEACHLFAVKESQVDVVVHPESIIHSMVSYKDGSSLAQLGLPDMRTPIAYALSYPHRINSGVETLKLPLLKTLTFDTPDLKRFPALKLCRDVMKAGQGNGAILNAANEVAVEAFLNNKILFGKIADVVEYTLNNYDAKTPFCFEDFCDIHTSSFKIASDYINTL